MSSRIRLTRTASFALVALGGIAIAAAAVAGLTGLPPAKAVAAPIVDPAVPTSASAEATIASVASTETTVSFGVAAGSAVTLGDEVLAQGKVGAIIAAAPAAHARLLIPAKQRAIVKKVPTRTVRTVARPRPLISKASWKKAKVSWYGPGFYGRRTASGARLKRDSMIVAHRSLKFGTKIQFTYKGRSVIAVVKDRGPFIHGRVFDLGPGTAKALRFNGVGTVKYRIIH